MTITDDQAQRLIRLYDEAEREILREMNRLLLKSPDSYSLNWQRTILARVRQIRSDLLKGARTWTSEAPKEIYMVGEAHADSMAWGGVQPGFGRIHQQAVAVLADNAYSRFISVDQIIGRRTNDLARQVALENIRGSVIGYETTREAARRIKDDLAKRGVTGFVDRAGREWNMSRYALMVANETTNQAFRQGTINRFQERNHDLVRLSSHSGSCPRCVPFQGRTFSLSGQDPEFPPLSEAEAGGVFHVGCRHVLSLAPEEKDRFLERLEGKFGEDVRQSEIDRLAAEFDEEY